MKTALLALLAWSHPPVRDWQVCLSGMHGQQVHPYCIKEFTLDEAIRYIHSVAPCEKNLNRGPVGLPGEQPYYYISYEPDKTCGRCHKGLK